MIERHSGTGLGWPHEGNRADTSDSTPFDVSRETPPGEDRVVSRETAAQGTAAHEITASAPYGDEVAPVVDGGPTPDQTPIATAAENAMQIIERKSAGVLPPPPQTRVMVVANQKGGVGKTTTAVNLAASLALHGLRVLVIDLDPQGNASTALGVDHREGIPSVYDVLVEGRPLDDVVSDVEGIPGLFCAPATIDLAGAEIELVSLVAREARLKRALDGYTGEMDYILIDCPPSLGLLTVNALVAGPEVLIPIQCEYYALEGLGQLLSNVDLVKSHLNPALHVSTIILTMYDGRTRLASQVADEVRQHFSAQVLRTAVPRSVRISEAPSYGQTVMTYDPGSTGALSYLEAAREIALRGQSGAAQEKSGAGLDEARTAEEGQ